MANDGVGHQTNGFVFCVVGLWHLFNHIKLHALNPETYTSLIWFPTSKIKYLELYLIMVVSSISFTMELFLLPPLDPDGTISYTYLRHFEHCFIAFAFFVYAIFAILLDKLAPPAHYGLSILALAVAFALELLLFHFHSTDHMGIEGHYHWLLTLVLFTTLATTLLSIKYSKSFLISFVRSLSLLFQGIWLINIGFVLWTPGLTPRGCFMSMEDSRFLARCHDKKALERAKALATFQFSCYLVGLLALGVTIYLVMVKLHLGNVEYQSLTKLSEKDDDDGIEAHERLNPLGKI